MTINKIATHIVEKKHSIGVLVLHTQHIEMEISRSEIFFDN